MIPDDTITFTRQQVTNMLNTMLNRDPVCALMLQKLNEQPPPPEMARRTPPSGPPPAEPPPDAQPPAAEPAPE